ncbi:predicted protein [Lichtheimia corymbifera JMRC:FSU:9682]|uniref:Uncharacterized protein n=1 Tax=Lichtheimia corymbifera JMRC:FSU:9682 TaxID=1263082 RepID=A0A068RUK8_9FUNG|nr:predicted protein [Lichtheimia corymbifera JMRC:FSU:9682]
MRILRITAPPLSGKIQQHRLGMLKRYPRLDDHHHCLENGKFLIRFPWIPWMELPWIPTSFTRIDLYQDALSSQEQGQ